MDKCGRRCEFTGLEHNLPPIIHQHCCLMLLLLNLRKKLKQCKDKFQILQNDFNHLKLILLKCRSSWRNKWLNLMVVNKRLTLMKSRLYYGCLDSFYQIYIYMNYLLSFWITTLYLLDLIMMMLVLLDSILIEWNLNV